MTETYLHDVNEEYEYTCEIAGQLHYYLKDLLYCNPLEDQQENIAYMKECTEKISKFLDKITRRTIL